MGEKQGSDVNSVTDTRGSPPTLPWHNFSQPPSSTPAADRLDKHTQLIHNKEAPGRGRRTDGHAAPVPVHDAITGSHISDHPPKLTLLLGFPAQHWNPNLHHHGLLLCSGL